MPIKTWNRPGRRPQLAASQTGLVFLLLWLLQLSLLGTGAALPPSTFEQANQLYEQRKYPEAAQAYAHLLQQGTHSPELHFNLGNALFKSGETGQAILHYRLAAQLLPRDRDVMHNLRFARGVAQGAALASGGWRDWTALLSLNELAWIFSSLVWAFFCLLIVGQLWPERRRSFRSTLIGVALVAAISGAWLAWRWFEDIGSKPAVVTTSEAVVRLGPFEESQSSFVLRNGAEIQIANTKEDWFQIRDRTGRSGWLKKVSVAPLFRSPP